MRPGRKPTHGAFSIIATGRLPEKRKYLEVALTEAREGLIKDCAGQEENLTTAQGLIIDRAIGKLAVIRCLEEYARERRAIMEGGELLPCLKHQYLQWSESFRRDLQSLDALGQQKAEEERWDPIAEIQKLDEEKEKEAKGNN